MSTESDQMAGHELLYALERPGMPSEDRFDRLTRLAATALSAPIAVVALAAHGRHWFKSQLGLAPEDSAHTSAFCRQALAHRGLLLVDDATLDARFAANALVTGAPHIRAFAGHAVYGPDGQALGALCVFDSTARQFDGAARQVLRDLASLVQDELNKTTLIDARNTAEIALHALNSELEQRIADRTRTLRALNESLQREMQQRMLAEATLRAGEERIRTIIDTSFTAFVSIDADCCIADWNPAAERTFGWSREQAVGLDLAILLVPPRFHSNDRKRIMQSLAEGDSAVLNQRLEMPALTRTGEEITVELTINAFHADGKQFFGAFVNDISEQRRIRQALEQKQELLDAVLETVDVGVVACTADGTLSLFNRAAREYSGLTPGAADSAPEAAQDILFAADGVTPLALQDMPLYRALHGETLRDVPIVIAPAGLPRRCLLASGRHLHSRAGEALGAVIALKDITALNDTQHRLIVNEQRLRDITDNVPALIGHIDKDCRFAFLNSQALRYYGKAGQDMLGKHISTIYTEEQFDKLQPLLRKVLAGERIDFEDDMIVRDKLRYFHASYIPDIDSDGAVQGFYALGIDITARKNSEIRQRESEERLRTIADNLPVLIAYIDAERRYRFANAMYKTWLGIAPADMLGRTGREIFSEQFCDQRTPHLDRCLQGQVSEVEVTTCTEPERVLQTVFIPHFRDGAVIGAYLLSTDVTAARQQEARLQDLANTDPLTGLPNRRSYEAALEGAALRARQQQQGMALMFLDIDHFKQVNDAWGHAAGDEVLQEFARRLLAVVRKSDIVCRLAGDEFTIVLEDVPSPEVCQRLGAAIIDAMQAPFIVDGVPRPVSTSIGIAWDGAGKADPRTLTASADSALYKAKEAGRKRFHLDAGSAPEGGEP